MKTLLAIAAIAAASSLCAASAEAASPVPPKSAEPELRTIETDVLGPDHAAEHAQDRADMRRELHRWRSLSPAQQHDVVVREQSVDRRLARVSAAAGTPSEVGAWTAAPFDIPAYGIHSVVLPTGKVLMWSFPYYPNDPNQGRAFLWDPSKGTGSGSFTEVPPPLIDLYGDGNLVPATIFCSAQSFLPNGDVLVAGGTLAWPNSAHNPTGSYLGLDRLFTFDPWTESWIEQPRLRQGRWYPSQVELADGRTAILGGTTENPTTTFNTDLELFTPSLDAAGVGTVEHEASGDRSTTYYPHLFTLPSGNVLLAGPGNTDSAILNTGGFTWTDLSPSSGWRWAGSAVLRPQGPAGSSVVTQIGGTGTNPNDTADNAYGVTTTETIDASQPTPTWHPDASLNVPRAYANTVLLPDRSMVEVGGGQGWSSTEGNFATLSDGSERQVELYDPATDSWRLGPAQQEDRTYHSTAVLLPDGRVLSAGDNFHPLNTANPGHFTTTDTAEIYSPPYLFKGSRPVIASAPDAVRWGDEFGVHTQSGDVTKAVLMAPDATTHTTDMSQRLVPLRIVDKVPGDGVNLASPPSAAVAPPGYYMLFLLDAKGVPSVARWVRLDGAAPDQPSLDTGAGPPAARAAAPHVSVRAATKRRAFRRRGRLSLNVTLDGPGAVVLRVKLRNPRTKRPTSRQGSLTMDGPGSGTVTLDFPKAVRPSVGSSVLVRITATGPQGDAASSSSRLRLRR